MNDYQFKVVKLEGDFVWHRHEETDETFIVIEGELRIALRDGPVRISAGEMYIVPKGVEHKPFAPAPKTTSGYDDRLKIPRPEARLLIAVMAAAKAGSVSKSFHR